MRAKRKKKNMSDKLSVFSDADLAAHVCRLHPSRWRPGVLVCRRADGLTVVWQPVPDTRIVTTDLVVAAWSLAVLSLAPGQLLTVAPEPNPPGQLYLYVYWLHTVPVDTPVHALTLAHRGALCQRRGWSPTKLPAHVNAARVVHRQLIGRTVPR
jgi:hypothetical protein